MKINLRVALNDPDGYGVVDHQDITLDVPDKTLAGQVVDRQIETYGAEGFDVHKNYDYNYSESGPNQLTVAESAKRASEKISERFVPYGQGDDRLDSRLRVYQACEALITFGVSRHELYKLGGGIQKGADEGAYYGIPLSVVFEYRAQQKITEGNQLRIGE